jgi:UDP-glucose 4-epimerase
LTRFLARDRQGIESILAADLRVPGPEAREEGVTYEVLDVRSSGLAGALREHRIDTVVHLAAIVSPRPEMTREFLREVEVEGTRNLLEACVAAGVEKVVVTSSGAAYGYHADGERWLTEESPLRGNPEFAYSDHKRLVEEMLADYRERHPALGQLIFRVGTVLGETVSNQITALFEKPVVLGLAGAPTPFVFIWDEDMVRILARGVHTGICGIFNVAGDGTLTLREIARRLGKPYLELEPSHVERGLGVLQRLGLSRYGPEQVGFLRYRPVLANDRLKEVFGYRPALTSREVFELYARARVRSSARASARSSARASARNRARTSARSSARDRG